MRATVYLITPPFTQLNTPYPATAYLKGFLNKKNIPAYQSDLGIEVILDIFSKKGLCGLFDQIDSKSKSNLSENAVRMIALKDEYIKFISPVVHFLQGADPTFAGLIEKRGMLPEASRFEQMDDLEPAFGTMGIQDRAKHIATMFLEDLSDLIKECIDPHFGFSRYAEKLGRSANRFDELYESLQNDYTYTDHILLGLLEQKMKEIKPSLVALSVPFPGNLYASLRCAQWIKKHHPNVKTVMGGGFANTELRSLSDPRVFDFFDFITLDDGEAPLELLVGYMEGKKSIDELKRTMLLSDGKVAYFNNTTVKDYTLEETGTPDYSDLPLKKYISAIEIINPMHRLWSDGRWNKLTMAHGCYWGKCTFCDISLDYISSYVPVAATILCTRMEEMIASTGETGFHFVDEAAPPALMRALAMEIIRRSMTVTWWTNIRFEKSFTADLCLLLKASGCIAVSGGLEVASDRLLKLIDKGITVAQVARVNRNFTQAGIMVHAYLMYGFPTQTAQETIDSLDMVRQMFRLGILQSAFWHRFTMTAHSPVGLDPDKYQVQKISDITGTFANNDIEHTDPSGADHASFSFGLKKSLLNYMHGIGLDDGLSKWFDFKIPKTKVDPQFIATALVETEAQLQKPTSRVIWLGKKPVTSVFTQSKKGMHRDMLSMSFYTSMQTIRYQLPLKQGEWLRTLLETLAVHPAKSITLQEVKTSYELAGLLDFELFWNNKPVNTMNKIGLLVI